MDREKTEPTPICPRFMKADEETKITNAEKGTLIHLCMQKLDEKKEYTINSINELINELITKKIITQKEANAISPYKILAFTRSSIWKELQHAKQIEKEKPFYINIPAKEIAPNIGKIVAPIKVYKIIFIFFPPTSMLVL